MLKLWGKDRAVIGSPLSIAVSELADQPFLEILKEVWRSGKTYFARDIPATLEIDSELKQFYFDFEYKAILDESGNTAYILHTTFEVSERLKAWDMVEEKSRKEQELNESLMAINEEYQTTNEELSALNEEYLATNEELSGFQARLQLAHKMLSENESRFRALIEHAPVAIAIYSGQELTIEQANEHMLALWGQGQQVIGMPLLKARPELPGHQYIEVIRKVATDGITHTAYEIKGPVQRDGKTIEGYFDVVYKALFDEHPRVTGVIAVASNITEQTLARIREDEISEEIAAMNEELSAPNRELSDSRRKLQSLFDELNLSKQRSRMIVKSSPVAMAALKGKNLTIEVANERVLQIWGKGSEVIGMPLAIALPELSGQPFLAILDKVFTTGEPFYGEGLKATLVHHGVPQVHYLNFVYQPVMGLDGLTDVILVVANDGTEQFITKQAADELNLKLTIAKDASQLGSAERNLTSGILTADERYKQNFGYAGHQALTYGQIYAAILPEYQQRVASVLKEAIASGAVFQAE